jgi:Fur family ferric uptake transcriptional regulator
MLHDRLEEDNFHVSRASIYNTIELLLEARLIVRHQFSLQLVQYELISVSAKHHHTICNYCGAVKEIKNDRMIDGMENCRIPKFTYEHHLLYIYGMCSKCKFKLANKNKKDNS